MPHKDPIILIISIVAVFLLMFKTVDSYLVYAEDGSSTNLWSLIGYAILTILWAWYVVYQVREMSE